MYQSRDLTNARRHAAFAEYRRVVWDKLQLIPFPHQADWILASEGYTLVDRAPTGKEHSQLVRLPDGSVTAWACVPREGGAAHVLTDLAAFKAGKSFSLAMFAAGFAAPDLPDGPASVEFVGLEYETSEMEFDYLAHFLLSEAGMNLDYFEHRNNKKDGAMWIELQNGAYFRVRSYRSSRKSDSMKGKTRDCYVFCEAFMLPGLQVYSHVSQNLRQRNGFACFATTPDRAWVTILHEKAHGKDPHWHCPTPDMRILTADLRWRRAGDLQIGDALVGFDEEPTPGPGAGRGFGSLRRFRTSRVTHASRARQYCKRIVLSDGTVITVSREHLLLAVSSTGHGRRVNRWVSADDLKTGMRIRRWFQPWEIRDDRDGGYLAGFYDGEGHINKLNPIQPLTIGAAQNRGRTLDDVLSLIRRLGYTVRTYSSKRQRDDGCLRFFIHGKIGDRAKFLGEVRPQRLLDKFQPEMLGALHFDMGKLEVISVEDAGLLEVVQLSTDTRTYILEGLASHNCVCETGAECNPFTFDQAAKDRDDPDKGGLMTRERFDIAWRGKVKRHIGMVYDYSKEAQMLSPLNFPDLWSKEALIATADLIQ